MRAKAECGLKALLMGEYSAEAMARWTDPNDSGRVRVEGGSEGGPGGNGRGNGAGKGASPRPPASVAPRADALGIQWQQTQYKVICPDCQGQLSFREGCQACDVCGFSNC